MGLSVPDAIQAALKADDVWQRELNYLAINRYSAAAEGVEGSNLRRYWEEKLQADDVLSAAFARQRTGAAQ